MSDRIDSLDALKGVALLAVFFIHARGSFIDNYQVNTIPGFILINTARFAVPVFFLISGYIFHIKTENHGSWKYTKKYLKNVGKYYVLGSVFWLVIQSIILYINSYLEIEMLSGYIQLKIFSLESILYFGDAVSPHLWFLTALFISIALIHLFERINQFKTLFGISAILHVIGILSIAYHVPVGFKVPINDALFFGLFLTSVGYYIAEKKPELKNRRNLLLSTTVILIFLHLVERTALAVILNSSPPYKWSGFSFLTAPMSVSIFLYALSRPELGEDSRISEYGRETLWGYILHPAVLGLLIGLTTLLESWTGLNLLQNVAWSILITVTAYISTMEFLCSNLREKIGSMITDN